MVEVKLETAGFEPYANDHYISMRVGEAQKLAKLSTSRSFKFPGSVVGNRKYGKVEIFKRVAQGTVCIDAERAKGQSEVDIAFDGFTLRVNCQVKETEDSKKPKTKANSIASEYFDKHHLEVRLSDAMQACLRERPEDPAAYIAQHLTSNGNIVDKLPGPPPGDPPVEVRAREAEEAAAAAEQETRRQKAEAEARKKDEEEKANAGGAEPVRLKFKDAIKRHYQTEAPDDIDDLRLKFKTSILRGGKAAPDEYIDDLRLKFKTAILQGDKAATGADSGGGAKAAEEASRRALGGAAASAAAAGKPAAKPGAQSPPAPSATAKAAKGGKDLDELRRKAKQGLANKAKQAAPKV